jgi:flagellar hook-associated protein 2
MSDSSYTTPTGMTGAGGGNLLRITGMATGLDVDAMVKKMLTAEQTKVDKAKQDQQLLVWKQEAYQDIISSIKDLQNSFFDPLDPSKNLLSSAMYNNLATSSSNSSVLNATAQTGAAVGTYTINVTQLAKSAVISSGESLNAQVQVSNIADWSGSITFSVDETSADPIDLSGFTPSGDNSKDLPALASYINKQISSNASLNGKVSASYVQDSDGNNYIKFTPTTSSINIASTDITDITDASIVGKNFISISGNTKLTSLDSSLADKLSLNLSYNGKSMPVELDNSASGKNGAATINDLITAIKMATGGQVTGSFDDISGKFVLQTTGTGSTTSLSVTDSSLSTALGISGSQQGADAVVQITSPGSTTPSTVTKNTNDFTLNNVAYSLNSIGTSTISVTADTQAVHDKIKDLLDKYNAVIDKIQTKLNEKKDYDYQPLTDAQKSEMKDSDITTWNEKAQQGILRNDDNLEKLLSDLRSAFVTPLTDSSGDRATSVYFGNIGSGAIGIDTASGKDALTDGDKITIVDDAKLNDAILNHADDLVKLFTNVATDDSGKQIYSESGIFQRMDTVLKNNVGYTGTTYNNAILTKYANVQDDYTLYGGGNNTLPDQLYQQQQLITKLTDAMNDKQEQYYQKFSQLETAMESLNAQQSQLSQLMGS